MKHTSEKEAEPTLDEWRSLYEAAAAYRDLAPWDWMHDDVLFGVENPETGQVGYCCILGAAGMQYGMAMYRGTEGLESYWRMAVGPPAQETGIAEILERQSCLLASFEDRVQLEAQDRATIKALGLRFRGSCAWPLFRSYRPCYAPWRLTGAEARFLTVALEQAVDVAARVQRNPRLLPWMGAGRYLVRTPLRGTDGAVTGWKDRKRVPRAPRRIGLSPAPLDSARIERARRLPRTDGRLELDYFLMAAPVGEKNERPYLPHLILAVDSASGFVLQSRLLDRDEPAAEALPDTVLKVIEEARALPEALLVQRPECLLLLLPLIEALGIEVVPSESLPALNTARFEFERFLGRGSM